MTKLQASPLHSHKILESGHLCQGEGRYITSWTGGTRTVDNRRMCMEELTRGNKPQAATSSHQQPQDRGVQEHSAVPAPARSPDHPNAPCWAAEEAYSQQGFGGSCLQHQKPDWLDHLQAALQYKQNINLKKCSFYLLHFGGKKKSFHSKKKTGMLLLETENWVYNILLITSLQTLRNRHKGSRVAFLSSVHRCWLTSL